MLYTHSTENLFGLKELIITNIELLEIPLFTFS